MRTRQVPTVAIVVAAALPLAGTACGGDDDGDGLTRAELARKANAICARAQAAARAVPAPASYADAGVAAAYFRKIAPITHRETEDLAALDPDSSVESDWQAFVDKQRAADELLQALKRKAEARDPSGQRDLRKVLPTARAVSSAAERVGATRCSEGG